MGENSIIAAMAFVKAGARIPPNSLAVGTPAKVVRELSADEITWKRQGTGVYQQLAVEAKVKLAPEVALTEVEPNRRRAEAPKYGPLVMARKGFQG